MLSQDSKQVELSKLNPDKAYIQVTFAEPYFDNYGKLLNFLCLILKALIINITPSQRRTIKKLIPLAPLLKTVDFVCHVVNIKGLEFAS